MGGSAGISGANLLTAPTTTTLIAIEEKRWLRSAFRPNPLRESCVRQHPDQNGREMQINDSILTSLPTPKRHCGGMNRSISVAIARALFIEKHVIHKVIRCIEFKKHSPPHLPRPFSGGHFPLNQSLCDPSR